MIKVFGHKNPDADSTISSIAVSDVLNKTGRASTACTQGDLTNDSTWILEKFSLEAPELIEEVKGEKVALVDTTTNEQLPQDIEEAKVVFVLDHHNLGSLRTSAPLEMWIRPVGCCGTIIQELYNHHNLEIPKNIAGALIATILNDTVMFKSPTTTEADKIAVEELNKIAQINVEEVGMEMFKVKSDVNLPAERLIRRDFKNVAVGQNMFGIGQIELIDADHISPSKQEEIISEMNRIKNDDGYETVIMIITDIIKQSSYLLVVSNDMFRIDKAFDTKIENNVSKWLPGVMSRKKQIIPPILSGSY
ncbi:MAG: manganese-dependent inorganic pyrophosphatase [Alphaproteobacteria bacterium]|nr:manganese-dependent inorganic pyrophosphatase [Alphaproteobacteria bacterium]